jgi:hypothetical protein
MLNSSYFITTSIKIRANCPLPISPVRLCCRTPISPVRLCITKVYIYLFTTEITNKQFLHRVKYFTFIMYSVLRSVRIGSGDGINIEKCDTSFAHHFITVSIEELYTLKKERWYYIIRETFNNCTPIILIYNFWNSSDPQWTNFGTLCHLTFVVLTH